VTVGKNLQVSASVSLSGRSSSPVVVTLQSQDPTRLMFSTSPTGTASQSINVTIPLNQTVTPDFYVQAFDSVGTVGYTVSAPSFGSVNSVVTLAPSGLVIQSPAGFGSDFIMTLGVGDATLSIWPARLDATGAPVATQAVASGMSLTVTVGSDTPGVGTITISPFAISGGSTYASTGFHPVGNGSATITATSPGYASATVHATVQPPSVVVGGGYTIGQHLQQDTTLILPLPAPTGGLDVTLQSNSPSLLLSSSATAAGSATLTLHLAAGNKFATYYLQSLGTSGTVSYTANATGYSQGTGTVDLAPSGVVITGPTTVELSGGPQGLSVITAYLDSTGAPVNPQALAGGPSLAVTLHNSNSAAGTVPGTVTITPGNNSATATFTPLGAGITTVSVDQPAGWTIPTSLTHLTITVHSTTASLGISKTHAGNFVQGQSSAVYTVTVSNASGASPTSGAVVVTETLPTGLSMLSMVGTGWTCPAGGTTCSRSDVLAGGVSYATITVTVSVAANAPSLVTNQVTVSGGGSASAGASDPTTVLPLPVQVVSITPSSGTGNSATFALTVSDFGGTSAITSAVLLVNNTLTGTGGCFLNYNRAANTLSLANDSASAWVGPSTVGSGASLSNSQCTVTPATASVAANGNNLTVNVPLTFKASFAGAKTTWGDVSDNLGADTGYRAVGSWTVTAPQTASAKIGVYNNVSGLFLLDANGNFLWDGTPTDKFFSWGVANHNPRYKIVVGDWNGSGTQKMGIFDSATATWLLDYNGDGVYTPGVDKYFQWGSPNDIPVVGDWNGSGTTKVGTFGPATGLWLLDFNGNFTWDGPGLDKYIPWGSAGDTPVIGDWNGSGTAKVGTFGPNTGWWLLDYNGNFTWDGPGVDKYMPWGSAGDTPVVGDWNGSGKAKIGTFGPATGLWLLDYNGNFAWDGAGVDKYFAWGSAGDTPVLGDWNGSGTMKVGTFGPNTALWLLDYNGNFTWDGASVDKYFPWGSPGDTPAVGRW